MAKKKPKPALIPIGKAIAKSRSDAGLTQATLASELRITQQSVADWERGITAPTGERLQKLLGILPSLRQVFSQDTATRPAKRSVAVLYVTQADIDALDASQRKPKMPQ